MIYTCSQGDTFDSIAFKAYSDEFLFTQIMEANRQFADVVIFDGGERVTIPDMVLIDNTIVSTPWQTGNTIRIIDAPWG